MELLPDALAKPSQPAAEPGGLSWRFAENLEVIAQSDIKPDEPHEMKFYQQTLFADAMLLQPNRAAQKVPRPPGRRGNDWLWKK